MRKWGRVCFCLVGGVGVKEGNRGAEGKRLVAGCVWGGCFVERNLAGKKLLRVACCFIKININININISALFSSTFNTVSPGI